jgi:hypothetical protein
MASTLPKVKRCGLDRGQLEWSSNVQLRCRPIHSWYRAADNPRTRNADTTANPTLWSRAWDSKFGKLRGTTGSNDLRFDTVVVGAAFELAHQVGKASGQLSHAPPSPKTARISWCATAPPQLQDVLQLSWAMSFATLRLPSAL